MPIVLTFFRKMKSIGFKLWLDHLGISFHIPEDENESVICDTINHWYMEETVSSPPYIIVFPQATTVASIQSDTGVFMLV